MCVAAAIIIIIEADDEKRAFDAGFFPGREGGAEDVYYGIGGCCYDCGEGGEVAAQDGVVEGGGCVGCGGEGGGGGLDGGGGGVGVVVGWGVAHADHCCCGSL